MPAAPPPAQGFRLDPVATAADAALLRALYPLYLHDLAAHGADYTLDADGTWQPDLLPYWLSPRAETHALLLRVGAPALPAGFALVGTRPFPFMTEGVDVRMAEFFVLAPHRRTGLGRRAAHALFDRFPGTWEVAQLPRNAPAIAFWRSVIRQYTGGAFTETTLAHELRQTFTSRARAA